MTIANKLRDSNFGSRRQSIIQKYDTTGDGVFQSEAIDNIVDDYMATILNNNTLLDTNYNQKKLLGFASILIIILSFANLGTAILAANISKETVVIDGRFVTNDGSAEAISTRNSVNTITKKDPRWDPVFSDTGSGEEDGEEGGEEEGSEEEGSGDEWEISGEEGEFEDWSNEEGDERGLTRDYGPSWDFEGHEKDDSRDYVPFICFTNEEVDAIFESTIQGSGTNIIIQSDQDDGSISRTVVPIRGAGREGRKGFSFPDSHVEFVPDDKGLCSEGRRRMHWGNTFHNSVVHNVNRWMMVPSFPGGNYALF